MESEKIKDISGLLEDILDSSKEEDAHFRCYTYINKYLSSQDLRNCATDIDQMDALISVLREKISKILLEIAEDYDKTK
jgi:hypothetical protein